MGFHVSFGKGSAVDSTKTCRLGDVHRWRPDERGESHGNSKHSGFRIPICNLKKQKMLSFLSGISRGPFLKDPYLEKDTSGWREGEALW